MTTTGFFPHPPLSGTGLRPIPKLNICLPNMHSCDQPAAGLLHSMPPASSLSREKELGAELRAKFRQWFGNLFPSLCSLLLNSLVHPQKSTENLLMVLLRAGADTAFWFPNGRKQQISFFSKVTLLFCLSWLEGGSSFKKMRSNHLCYDSYLGEGGINPLSFRMINVR